MKHLFTYFLVLLSTFSAFSQRSIILKEKDRAVVVDEVIEDRFKNLLPVLMRETGIDMWIVISREYNEDPVLKTMLPSEWLSARRRTILVYFDNGKEVERFAIARYDVGNLLKGEWDIATNPDQWDALVKIVRDKNPKKIGLNFSKYYAHADGLTFTEHKEFTEKLTAKEIAKITSASDLAVRWLETRTPKEQEILEQVGRISHEIIQDAFTSKVIQPGVTSTEDVVWWFRQRVTDLGLETWFHPTVDIQRADETNFNHLRTFSKKPAKEIIQFGDLVHCDFGITYLRLNSDHQQIAYILKPGESKFPDYLKNAFVQGNQLQDFLTAAFKTGKSGNDILAEALLNSKNAGIKGTIYTHPIGMHGHAAGPTIGMWDNQGKTVGAGDFKMNDNTAYSIELNAAVEIPEWKKSVRIMLEENGIYDGKTFRYFNGRQKDIILIGGPSGKNKN